MAQGERVHARRRDADARPPRPDAGRVLSDAAPAWAGEPYGYLTTRGRRTGRAHRIEIWFAWADGACWLLTEPDGATDWVRNLEADPAVTFEVLGAVVGTHATLERMLPDDAPVRAALAAKYDATYGDEPLGPWAAGALAVRITP